MPAPSITLVIVSQTIENVDGVPYAELTMRTQNPVDVPDDKWFVVERLADGSDSLVCVASVADFTNLPDVAPDEMTVIRYWRTNEITYRTDFPEYLQEALDNTNRRIRAAIEAFKQIAANPGGTTTVFD